MLANPPHQLLYPSSSSTSASRRAVLQNAAATQDTGRLDAISHMLKQNEQILGAARSRNKGPTAARDIRSWNKRRGANALGQPDQSEIPGTNRCLTSPCRLSNYTHLKNKNADRKLLRCSVSRLFRAPRREVTRLGRNGRGIVPSRKKEKEDWDITDSRPRTTPHAPAD